MADRMAADGYKEAGYEYIIIDDCWPAHERTAAGQLQPDPDRFPSGIKALADYVSTKDRFRRLSCETYTRLATLFVFESISLDKKVRAENFPALVDLDLKVGSLSFILFPAHLSTKGKQTNFCIAWQTVMLSEGLSGVFCPNTLPAMPCRNCSLPLSHTQTHIWFPPPKSGVRVKHFG